MAQMNYTKQFPILNQRNIGSRKFKVKHLVQDNMTHQVSLILHHPHFPSLKEETISKHNHLGPDNTIPKDKSKQSYTHIQKALDSKKNNKNPQDQVNIPAVLYKNQSNSQFKNLKEVFHQRKKLVKTLLGLALINQF